MRSFYLRLARSAGGRVAGAHAKLNPLAVLLPLGIVEHAHRRDASPPCVALCEAARVLTGRGHGRPAGFPRLPLLWFIDRDARGLTLEKGRSVQLEKACFFGERSLGFFCAASVVATILVRPCSPTSLSCQRLHTRRDLLLWNLCARVARSPVLIIPASQLLSCRGKPDKGIK